MFDMTIESLLLAGVGIIALVRGGAYIVGRWDHTLEDRSERRRPTKFLHN